MNKNNLIEIIAETEKISKNNVKKCLNGLKNLILDALKKGEEINIKGFGTFFTREYSERYYTCPLTKRTKLAKNSIRPKFKFSSKIRFQFFVCLC